MVKIGTQLWLKDYYAVIDKRGLCPQGWHVPSDDDWQVLCDYLGGNMVAGGKMKESGTAHWKSPNEGATNESGFTASCFQRWDTLEVFLNDLI
jgi:uncharacterized protein (TIGR02145 family)